MGGRKLFVTMMILYSSSDFQVELAPTSTALLSGSSNHHLLPDSSQEVIRSDIVDNFIRALPQEIKEQLNLNDKSLSTFSEAVEDLGGVITNPVDFDQSLEITDTVIDNMGKEISDQLTSMPEDNIASDIAIIKTDLSNGFRNFKNLLPDWAIIACVVCVAFVLMILMIFIAYNRSRGNKLSNQIQSLSFQNLQDSFYPDMINSTNIWMNSTTLKEREDLSYYPEMINSTTLKEREDLSYYPEMMNSTTLKGKNDNTLYTDRMNRTTLIRKNELSFYPAMMNSPTLKGKNDNTFYPEMMNSPALKGLDRTSVDTASLDMASMDIASVDTASVDMASVSTLDAMSPYNIGYSHIYGNEVSSSWDLHEKTQKSIFQTSSLPKCFTKFKKTNNFKHMDDLLQAYYSLDINN